MMGKIKQRLARNELSRGEQQADAARNSGGAEVDSTFENAYKKFSSAAILDPGNANIFHSWGLTLYDQADRKEGKQAKDLYKAACEKFEKALELDPNNAKVLNDWGAILMRQARDKPDARHSDVFYEKAKEKILAANDLKPGIGAYNIACLHSLRGEQEECRKYLNQAKETGNLPEKGYLKIDKDLDNAKDKDWFQEFIKELSEKADAKAKEEAQAKVGIEAQKSDKARSGSWWRRLKRSQKSI